MARSFSSIFSGASAKVLFTLAGANTFSQISSEFISHANTVVTLDARGHSGGVIFGLSEVSGVIAGTSDDRRAVT